MNIPIVLVGSVLLAIVFAVQFGAVSVGTEAWLAPLTAAPTGSWSGTAQVLWHIRVPRTVFAVLVGAALGLSGALTQGLFRNPLADPGLLGVTSGAACAAALTIVVFASSALSVPENWRLWLLPAMAFSGALLVCLLLESVARWIMPSSVAALLLTGVALNAVTMAVVGLCSYLATDEQLRNLSFWTLGSLAGAGWTLVAVLTLLLAVAWWRIRYLACALNALALGEAAAAHIGVDMRQVRTQVILWVALLSGFAVAWCGIIGFIGLIAPHLVRIIVGPDQRQVLPLSLLTGGLLLLVADTLARSLAIPAEIPVGIFTALLGGPFFLVLLRRLRSQVG